MIQLNENLLLDTDSTHGFKLTHSLPSRETKDKEGNIKTITPTQNYYLPNLKKALVKAIDLDLKGTTSLKEILYRLDNMEKSLEKFNNVFATNGKVFNI